MEELLFVKPKIEYKSDILEYKKEFIDNSDSMDGTAGLRDMDMVEEWIDAIEDNSREETVRPGLVPASTFIVIRISDSKIIGMIDIRHILNDFLLKSGGHIGYSVRKSERNKGYAKKMLSLALKKCSEFGIENVLVTCSKDNIASVKTILANGGILENEVIIDGKEKQRYWIEIK